MTETTPPVHERKAIPPPAALKKLPPDGGPEYNRLVFEKSPYLLQHAANPVDWYPWGDEAFEQARQADKPVFLSIGYTTCHWCHVMERESFEDQEVAALMNELFVCIKVDREERPDVDKIYMDITQAMTGSGGWPMTVILTPDKKPFFAGTYFPKESRGGRAGLLDILPQLDAAWKNDREKVSAVAARAADALVEINAGSPGGALGASALELACQQLESRFDPVNGGFSSAPKFPVPHNLSFLLRCHRRSGAPKTLAMVETTLTKMRLGGICDHVGYGFHRYATDAIWLLPHFEKMLYDQALLALAYLEAYQVTRRPFFADTAREIFAYVLRDMTSPEGGFYSAEDADSEGEEGRFYVWSDRDVLEVLGPDEGALFNKVYGIAPGGNFSDQATGERTGASIPHLTKTLPELAREFQLGEGELRARMEAARLNLFAAREKRIHPQKDDKILTDWNGLMIAALAVGAAVLDEPRYAETARGAADFVLSELRTKDGRLLKRYRQGEAGLPAHLEDYAFLVWGLLELYEATFELRYLEEALALNETLLAHYWDAGRGGFFITADDGEKLLVRGKEVYDGAIPSGNSVAARNLLRLARITGRAEYEERADGVVRAFSSVVASSPSSFTMLMQAVDFAVGPSYEIVVVGGRDNPDTKAMLNAVRQKHFGNKVVLLKPPGKEGEVVARIAPFTQAMTQHHGKATAYVCRNFACERPVTDVAAMLRNLGVEVEPR